MWCFRRPLSNFLLLDRFRCLSIYRCLKMENQKKPCFDGSVFVSAFKNPLVGVGAAMLYWSPIILLYLCGEQSDSAHNSHSPLDQSSRLVPWHFGIRSLTSPMIFHILSPQSFLSGQGRLASPRSYVQSAVLELAAYVTLVNVLKHAFAFVPDQTFPLLCRFVFQSIIVIWIC